MIRFFFMPSTPTHCILYMYIVLINPFFLIVRSDDLVYHVYLMVYTVQCRILTHVVCLCVRAYSYRLVFTDTHVIIAYK